MHRYRIPPVAELACRLEDMTSRLERMLGLRPHCLCKISHQDDRISPCEGIQAHVSYLPVIREL
jgi:hypothetical protein